MSSRVRNLKLLAFAVAAVLVTGIAAWVAFRITRSSLGVGGGILAGLAAAMIVGAPFYVVGALIWGPQEPTSPPRRSSAESGPRERLR